MIDACFVSCIMITVSVGLHGWIVSEGHLARFSHLGIEIFCSLLNFSGGLLLRLYHHGMPAPISRLCASLLNFLSRLCMPQLERAACHSSIENHEHVASESPYVLSVSPLKRELISLRTRAMSRVTRHDLPVPAAQPDAVSRNLPSEELAPFPSLE